MKIITVVIILCFVVVNLSGCTGAQVKAAIGCGIAGALTGMHVNKKNPKAGMLAGMAIGSAACVLVVAMQEEAAREAARTRKPAVRQKTEEREVYTVKAEPVYYPTSTPNAQTFSGSYNDQTNQPDEAIIGYNEEQSNCSNVKITTFKNGKEINSETREVCI